MHMRTHIHIHRYTQALDGGDLCKGHSARMGVASLTYGSGIGVTQREHGGGGLLTPALLCMFGIHYRCVHQGLGFVRPF